MSHGSIKIRGSILIGDVSQPNIFVPLANIINSWSCFYRIDILRKISFSSTIILMPDPWSNNILISILVTDYIQKKRGQALLLNVICYQIWYQILNTTLIGHKSNWMQFRCLHQEEIMHLCHLPKKCPKKPPKKASKRVQEVLKEIFKNCQKRVKRAFKKALKEA